MVAETENFETIRGVRRYLVRASNFEKEKILEKVNARKPRRFTSVGGGVFKLTEEIGYGGTTRTTSWANREQNSRRNGPRKLR